MDRYVTNLEYRALIALAWHDCVCPDSDMCIDRDKHAAVQDIVTTGLLSQFLERLSDLETEEALDIETI